MATEDKDQEQGQEQQQDEGLGDYEVVLDGEQASQAADEDKGRGERRAKEGGEERDDEREDREAKDDENLSAEDKEKRERRRQERKLRKQRREEERAELEELRRRNAILESRIDRTDRRIVDTEYRRIEGSLNEAVRQMNEAKALVDEAKAKENWGALDDAREAYMEARERASRLAGMKQQYEQSAHRHPEQPDDPEVTRRARSWRSKNSWYDPQGRDTDSRVTARLDAALVRDGYDPTTDEYWRELDRRVSKNLPHRASNREDIEELDDDVEDRGSPTSGSGRERASSGGKKTFRINSERRDALIELGAIDRQNRIQDKKLYERMVKRFMDYDKQYGAQQRGR